MPDWQPAGDVRRRKSVVLDASGNGTTEEFFVPTANSKWEITDILVATDQAQTLAPYPTATAYLGGQQVGTSEGATWTGNQDVMRGLVIMDCGLNLVVSFTGGVVGSKATAIIEGKNYLWR